MSAGNEKMFAKSMHVIRHMFVFSIIGISGCASLPIKNSSLEYSGIRKDISLRSVMKASGNRDVLNISPVVAISGSGFFVCLILLFLAGLMRSRQALISITKAIEQLEPTLGKEVKRMILRQVLKDRIADYLHKITRKAK